MFKLNIRLVNKPLASLNRVSFKSWNGLILFCCISCSTQTRFKLNCHQIGSTSYLTFPQKRLVILKLLGPYYGIECRHDRTRNKQFEKVSSCNLTSPNQCIKTSVKHTWAKDVVRGSVKGTGSTANMAPENKQTKRNQSHSCERNGRSINKQLNKMIKAQSKQAVLAELSGMLGQKKSWMCEMTKISFFQHPYG